MRLAVARFFHTGTVCYFACMDVLYALKVVEVFYARTDLLFLHYRGLGLQFFTVWSQGSLQIYFFVAFLYDVIESSQLKVLKQFKKILRIFKAVFFTSVVVPTAILVTVNYWILNSWLDPNLIEDTQVLQDYVPSWMNHSLHTVVLLFTLAELLLSYRPYPQWPALGKMRSTIVVLAYTTWVTLAVLIGSSWPYPYMGIMSVTEKLSYLLANCALAAMSYSLGEVINTIAWGRRCRVT